MVANGSSRWLSRGARAAGFNTGLGLSQVRGRRQERHNGHADEF
jgi:hypothetical protein